MAFPLGVSIRAEARGNCQPRGPMQVRLKRRFRCVWTTSACNRPIARQRDEEPEPVQKPPANFHGRGQFMDAEWIVKALELGRYCRSSREGRPCGGKLETA